MVKIFLKILRLTLKSCFRDAVLIRFLPTMGFLFSRSNEKCTYLRLDTYLPPFLNVISLLRYSHLSKMNVSLSKVKNITNGSCPFQSPLTTFHEVAISLGLMSSSSFHTWRHPSFGSVQFLISIHTLVMTLCRHKACGVSINWSETRV